MIMSRRNLLKALTAIPAIPFLSSRLAHALMNNDVPSNTYLLFHGMFFFEFAGNKLLIATPEHTPHKFYSRRHLGGFTPLQGEVTFTPAEVGTGGSMSSFPTEILQFPKAMLNKGSSVLSAVTAHHCRITLPLPTNIFAYRTDIKSHFHPDILHSSIAKAVFATAGPRLATITCLEYDGATAPFVASYYAEHCQPPTNVQDVNDALKAAAVQNFLGSKFDLQMITIAPLASTDDSDSLPDGITNVDEYEYAEFTQIRPPDCVHPLAPAASAKSKQSAPHNASPTTAQAADVASCPQFGLS